MLSRQFVRAFSTAPTFGRFAVNKAKAAIQFTFVGPTVEAKTSKAGSSYQILKQAGALRLELAPANAEAPASTTGAQTRSYNWQNKQRLQLSCNEIGELLAFGESTGDSELKVYHDPGKGEEQDEQT